jgi:hypothetical protein
MNTSINLAPMTTRRTPVLILGFVLATAFQLHAQQSQFPFSIQGDRFYTNGAPVFLQMIGYQPLEPGQPWDGEIREPRILDDLRRLQAYMGGNDPIILRVYPGPTMQFTNRMPKSFYDGVRELGLWIVRDIYFDEDYWASDATDRAWTNIMKVVSEVATSGAMNRIFAWEIGNEFTNTSHGNKLDEFLNAAVSMIKQTVAAKDTNCSQWVTWNCPSWWDPLWTKPDTIPPIPGAVTNLDYYSFNAYPYEPDRIRDHQGGTATGTPLAGYLAALADALNKPLMVSETGLADSPSAEGVHTNFSTWWPAYRKGGMTNAQVAEGLADRYWDARLLTNIAGIGYFEWNDEWWKWKDGNPTNHDAAPEEWFGLMGFRTNGTQLRGRFKLQQETVRDLFTLRFEGGDPGFDLVVSNNSLSPFGFTTIRAVVHPAAPRPVRFRWEASRGYITGDSEEVQFYAGGRALGPARITAVMTHGQHRAGMRTTNIVITPWGAPEIALLTLGTGTVEVARASGRVANADLDQFKVAVYIETNQKWVQPDINMKSIWVRPDGYWWTPVVNQHTGRLAACLVPKSYDPVDIPLNTWPPGAVGSQVLTNANDLDNDLLPDTWEPNPALGRWDDPDGDGANLLEEFLAGRSPTIPDNDLGDGLPDNWELHYFGHLDYGPTDDPDGDGLDNATELSLGLHPGRTASDRDRDGLPDLWELRWFGSLDANPTEDFNCDGRNYLDDYELGYDPPPRLRLGIRRANDDCVELSWPTNAACFSLWSSSNLNQGAAWTEVPNARATNESQFVVTVCGITNDSSFFRLRR